MAKRPVRQEIGELKYHSVGGAMFEWRGVYDVFDDGGMSMRHYEYTGKVFVPKMPWDDAPEDLKVKEDGVVKHMREVKR